MSLFLYYNSKNNGLVKENNRALGDFIKEHDEKDRKSSLHKQSLYIPNNDALISVHTTPHVSSQAKGIKLAMYATISLGKKMVINFHDKTLCHPVTRVCATPGDWGMLFDGIIQLYDSIYTSETPINTYFDVIEKNIVDTSGNYTDKIVNVTSRLAEISDNLPNSIYINNRTLIGRMKKACVLLLKTFADQGVGEILNTPTKRDKIESNMHSIFGFLSQSDKVLGWFNYHAHTAPMLSANSSCAPQSNSAERES